MRLSTFIKGYRFFYGYRTRSDNFSNYPIEPRNYCGDYNFSLLKKDRIALLDEELYDYFGRGRIEFVKPIVEGDLFTLLETSLL